MTAGMAPDLDVFIRSSTDPLLAIEYHRHFTHALAFIPIGGLIAALFWFIWKGYRERWRLVLLSCTLAVATHGLLDACTTYGTQLLWPFSNYRVGWDWISIIDPIFTSILLIGVAIAALRWTRRPAQVALALALGYIAVGAIQNHRALAAQEAIAASRGHTIDRGEAFATIGNHLVWRSLYRSGDFLYADRIRVPWWGPVSWTPGNSVQQVRLEDLSPEELADPAVQRDFERFSWFADGWVARAPGDGRVYGDVRYSLQTEAFDPIWGIVFEPGAPTGTTRWVSRTSDRELRLSGLWDEITGRSPDYRVLEFMTVQTSTSR